MAVIKYDVVVAESRGEGEKPYWRNIGAVFKTEKGFALRLNAVPTNWDGWAQLFVHESPEQRRGKAHDTDESLRDERPSRSEPKRPDGGGRGDAF